MAGSISQTQKAATPSALAAAGPRTSVDQAFDFANETKGLVDDIIAANAKTNGGGNLLNVSVDSIIHSASYYDSPILQGASILRGIVDDHTFIDGNKKTAVQAYRAFADRIGLTVTKTDDELFDVVTRVAKGELDSVDDIAEELID